VPTPGKQRKPEMWLILRSYRSPLQIVRSSGKLALQSLRQTLKPFPTTQLDLKVVYAAFIVAWFCIPFMVHEMNFPQHDVSVWISVALTVAASCAVVAGFVMRKKFFKLSAEALLRDPNKARSHWRAANVIGFNCALSVTVYGAALKLLGSGWLVPGIFFCVSLCLLLLWRPNPLEPNSVQPA
jgi:hypothetical protein